MYKYPINITIDTNVFFAAHYDLSADSTLRVLSNLVEAGKVKVFLSDIVLREARSHILEKAEKSYSILKKASKELNNNIDKDAIKLAGLEQYLEIPTKEAIFENLFKRFDGYIKSLNPKIFTTSIIDINEIVDDYFEYNAPFEKSEKKRKEFPDAFIAQQIRKNFPKKNSIVIISDDNGFRNACLKNCEYHLYNKLGELYNEISKQEEEYNHTLAVLKSLETDINDEIKTNIVQNGYITVYGLSYDRKGVASGYDYDETVLNNISNISHSIHIVDDIKDNRAIITLDCSADIKMDCYYDDYDSAPWDSETKEYVYVDTVHVVEEHNARFATRICLDIQNHRFTLNDVKIILGGDTRAKRYIVKENTVEYNGYEGYEKPYTTCPDCGCGISHLNDGGGGFCINCAPKH